MSRTAFGGTWLKRLAVIAAKPSRIVAGVMSGTSMDSIDVALCRIHGAGRTAKVELVAFYQEPYAPELARRLQNPAMLAVRDIAELNGLIGEAFAQACLAAFARAGMNVQEVDLIGSHGQTVYHHSALPGAPRSSLQLGDADVIALRTGLGVIADFRARDIAAGGEGAPLTPYADVILYELARVPQRAILNLGGIANITFVEHGSHGNVIGFDTGPANAPLDRLARIFSAGQQSYDVDGAFAKQGRVDEAMLDILLQDPYLLAAPPKSTGFEVYGDPFIERLVAQYGPVSCDMITTVTEFVAQTILDAIQRHVQPHADISELVLAGGGGRNPELRRRLRDSIAPIRLIDSDDLGVPSQAREAMAFALLANDALLGLPTSIPSVTGASQAVVLGKLSFPG
jgi:anhydro-N-acetylmuramic acid kinase